MKTTGTINLSKNLRAAWNIALPIAGLGEVVIHAIPKLRRHGYHGAGLDMAYQLRILSVGFLTS
jgi:hypothetical protein